MHNLHIGNLLKNLKFLNKSSSIIWDLGVE
uniref:Uncharacterized protein n=1 Tax=Rhizophora mucronata TaxID=61149 RepID=A0A2P2NLZ1_RHIMU